MKAKAKYLIALVAMLLPLAASAADGTVKAYFGSTPALKVSGKELVDPNDRPVTLHGVMDTPSPYFNSYRWSNGYIDVGRDGDKYVDACKSYFDKVFQAITDQSQGAYCNLFRLHLDPCWTNDPSKTATNGGGENDISRFSADRLRKYLECLYIPIAENAIKHGLYVIIRPPGVFPEDVTVGDEYNQYLITVWDIVSQNATVKRYSGQISLELGNEPVRMSGSLVDYFQPIVTKIRDNGFDGILWLPGTGYQSNYADYKSGSKTIADPKNNYGFAVHCYPGWYGGWNPNQTQANFIQTFENQVPVDTHPIVITEVDWSPGAYVRDANGNLINKNGDGNYETSNYGSWGTGSTTTQTYSNVKDNADVNKGWGSKYKAILDKHPNISWTLEGTDQYVDMAKYLETGIVQPAFLDKMRADGYPDAYEASSGAAWVWYKEYACGERLPMDLSDLGHGSAQYDPNTKRYYFRGPNNSWFEFSDLQGKRVIDCAELTIACGSENTTGYRLDFRMKDANGNIITDGTDENQHFFIGSESAGTRSESPVATKTYDLQTILKYYIENYPDCRFDMVRLNTALPYGKTEAEYDNQFYITLNGMRVNETHATATVPSQYTNLDDLTFTTSGATGFRFGESLTGGAVVAGDMTGNVPPGTYIDLAGYNRMEIQGDGGMLRLICNAYQPEYPLAHSMFCTWDGYGADANANAKAKQHYLEASGLNGESQEKWEKQITYKFPTPLPTGKYKLSFAVKGDIPQSAALVIWGNKNDTDGTAWYGGGEHAIGTNWKTITLTFTLADGMKNIDFNFGQYTGGTFCLDNVNIVRINDDETETTVLNSTFEDGETGIWAKPSWHQFTLAVGEEDATVGAYAIGESTGLPYGDGNVSGSYYADLTAYKALLLKVTDGTPRLLFNRQGMDNSGEFIEINSESSEYATLKNGVWTIDLAAITAAQGYAHLNCIKGANYQNVTIQSATLTKAENIKSTEIIANLNEAPTATIDLTKYASLHLNSIKVNWGSTATVNAIRLYNDNIVTPDYVLHGAGYEENSFKAALADATATSIDVTDMNNKVKKTLNLGAGSNPNCLFILSKKQGEDDLIGGIGQNRVTKEGTAYSAEAVTLSDGHPFRAPTNIATANASYARDLATEWATATIPFAVTVGYDTPEIYTLKTVNGTNMVFQHVEDGTVLPANTAIVYRNRDKGVTTLSGQNVAKSVAGYNPQPIEGLDGWYICQSMTDEVIADVTTDAFFKNYDVYGISGNQFVHATKKLTTKPFRAFFLHKKSQQQNAPTARFLITTVDDEATAIGIVGAGSQMQDAVEEAQRYDAAGQKISTPRRGINIVKMSDGTVRKEIR